MICREIWIKQTLVSFYAHNHPILLPSIQMYLHVYDCLYHVIQAVTFTQEQNGQIAPYILSHLHFQVIRTNVLVQLMCYWKQVSIAQLEKTLNPPTNK
jgi:hypothetical protein